MATYEANFYMKNGRRLNLHFPTQHPVGSYVPCEASGQASATSSFEFSVPAGEVWEVEDYTTTNTAGEIEIYKDTMGTGKYLPTTAARAESVTGRPKVQLTFVPGPRYKFRMTKIGAA